MIFCVVLYKPHGDAFGCHLCGGVESSVGFFNVNFVDQDPFVWVEKSYVMDHV